MDFQKIEEVKTMSEEKTINSDYEEEGNFKEKDVTTNDEEVKSNLEATKEELIEDTEDNNDMNNEVDLKEYEELNNRYLRLQADFVNYKKRVEKEKESIYTYSKEGLIMDFLNVIDNFDRAFMTVEDEKKEDNFYKGMEMVFKQFIDILNQNGLEEIEAINKEFDPIVHHAVMQEESDEHGENIIIDVFQKGYKLKDKVIRPSMVKVSK